MTPEQPSEQHDNATAEKVGAWLRTAWTRMTAKSSEGGEALPAPSRHPVLAKDTVRQRVESELYAMTVRAVESEVTVERLELELANAKAEIERLTEAELKARTRAGQEERAAFEAALKPMTELGQSLVKWAESWGNRLNAQLVSDLDTLSTAMQPLAHDMREIYRDAGATYGDTEDGMLRWWGEQADRFESQQHAQRQPGAEDVDADLAETSDEAASFGLKVRRFFKTPQS